MTKRYAYILAVAILTIIVLFVVYTKSQRIRDNETIPDIVRGTKLELVAEYKPLHLYIYADTTSTNEFPEYAVFEGVKPVFHRENTTSNTVLITDFENGFATLTTERDENERVLKHEVFMFDNLGAPSIHQPYNLKYIYVDDDGDGLFDKFIKFGTNVFTYTVYERSNLCWVPIRKNFSLTKQP